MAKPSFQSFQRLEQEGYNESVVHTFDTIEDLRRGLQDFVAHYNAAWLVARHGYRTPNQIRAEQYRLAQCQLANLPLAA